MVHQPLTCTRGETVWELIQKLVKRKVHRAWVLHDEEEKEEDGEAGSGRLDGVVTLTDLVELLYQQLR